MTLILEAAKRLKASDTVEYVSTPGAKKEKPADWKPDVPVVKSEAAAKGKHMPKPKLSKPHKAKAPANPEPKKKKPTKASTDPVALMAAAMREAKK